MTKSEFDGFAREVFSRFDELSKKVELMLPREIYNLRERQIVEDTQEINQRVTATEKAITELGSQLSTTRLATVNDTRSVEHQVASTRYESLDRIYDLLKYMLATGIGAFVTFILSYILTHTH